MKRLKEMTEFVFAVFYSLFLRISGRRPRRVVLYYHGLNKADLAGFRKQMTYISKSCSVVKVSQITAADVNETDVTAAITFDDAFVSVMENAVPILKEQGLTAGIFVPAGNLGRRPQWDIPGNSSDKDEMIMSEEQISELDKDGFEIFSHTLSHPRLTQIDNIKLKNEIIRSKQILEEIVDHEVPAISYPHGAYNEMVCRIARQAGYKFGFTIDPVMVDETTDNLSIGRFSVSPSESMMKFKLKTKGAYQITSHLRRMKSRLSQILCPGSSRDINH